MLKYDHNQYISEKILIPLGLKNTFFPITEVNLNDVMSGYYVGHEEDFKAREYGMLATAEDVGIFLRALNDGSVFDQGEKQIYPYEYNHGGLVVGYQSLAEYHKDIDAVVVQFINTTDFNGYEWNLSEITINRIVKILRKSNMDDEEGENAGYVELWASDFDAGSFHHCDYLNMYLLFLHRSIW